MASQSIDQIARDQFGFDSLLDGQREVIEHLLDGKSSAAIFPTGGGKSLCYQLPALMLDGLTLVVSPLLALMRDQIDALSAKGIVAHRLDSTQSFDEYKEVMNDVRSGRARLLYVAPERFNNERFVSSLRHLNIALFAIDEAHCISEWGHNFRPDYLKLGAIVRRSNAERVLALTATAPPSVVKDIQAGFDIAAEAVVRTPFYRENLALHLTPVVAKDKLPKLIECVADAPHGPTLVYVTLQKTAEFVAQRLTDNGFKAAAYHAGMKPEDRSRVQDTFLQSDDGIVVATIAFGMGIDKANIRKVIHFNLPKSLENLAQEIGRAGRDGLASRCETLVCPDDLTTLENFTFGDTPTEDSIGKLMREVFFAGDDPTTDDASIALDLYRLSKTTDIRPLVLRTLLTWLELEGWVSGGTPMYAGYRFKPLRTGAEILADIESDDERAFVRSIFKLGKRKKTWVDLDINAVVATTGSSRQDVVSALDRVAESGAIELKPQGVRHRVTVLKTPDDVDDLASTLGQRMVDREAAEMKRLGAVCALTEADTCQVRSLGAYFGDSVDTPCGHCSHCLTGPARLPARKQADAAAVDAALADVVDAIDALASKHPDALGHPRQKARFLCGLPSPAAGAARIGSHALAGRLDAFPFAVVHAALNDRTSD